MNPKLVALGLYTLAILSGFCQSPGTADSVRYNAEVFDEIEIINNVEYGFNVTQGGAKQKLLLDIYMPSNDTEESRPLVILAHGGYFLFGDKLEFEEECTMLAKSGYVAVSIDYRLIDVEETEFVSKRAVMDAVNDMKAAVRFFRKDAKTDNQYKIDPSNIFIGGYSAGAVTSLHYAYANTKEDVLKLGGEELLEYVLSCDGLPGNSGNPGHSHEISGVINIAGSIFSASLVDPKEPMLVSVHGTDDQVVPFMRGTTGETDIETEGSGLIHPHADEIGLVNELIAVEGEGHLIRYSCESCFLQIREFLYQGIKK